MAIRIRDDLHIPEDEIHFEASASSGPGGQHVNRVQTRVSLLFDVAGSRALTQAQKTRIQRKLEGRINKAGILRVDSERHRSQSMNREDALAKFVSLLSDAVVDPRPRKKTRVPSSEKRSRLEEKKRRSEIKKGRGPISGDTG